MKPIAFAIKPVIYCGLRTRRSALHTRARATHSRMVICIAEDRTSEEVALELLLLSLNRHCPGVPIVLTYPPASPEFRQWLTRIPQCQLRTASPPGQSGWNVKPYLLFQLLNEGYDPVWWVDSDILVIADFIQRLRHIPPETLVACEDAIYGSHIEQGRRTKAWGLELGRVLPTTLNSGVIRVTKHHIPLIQRWSRLLEDPDYRAAQKKQWYERPLHFMGDQDVLTALAGSKEFSHVPLHKLRRGAEIIQYFGFSGYTVAERVGNLVHGPPLFIHCQGWKPWQNPSVSFSLHHLRSYLRFLYIELSPYELEAQRYLDALGHVVPWLTRPSSSTRIGRYLGFNHPALVGLPMSAVFDLVRWSKGLKLKMMSRS